MKSLIVLIGIALYSCFSNNKTTEDLLYAKEVGSGKFAFFNMKGKKVLGDYSVIWTKTMKDYAIVSNPGPMLIDRNGNIVYHIFVFDNGPDYTRDGYYRIVENGKIGYVDSATSKLVIPPKYSCAYPFENGKAQVSFDCSETKDGEYKSWTSQKWFYIDKNGNVLK